jgi:hypothetical protein
MKRKFAGIAAWAVWRLVVDVWVLFYVWHHTHWSVALLLSGIQLRFWLADLVDDLRRLRNGEAEDFVARIRGSRWKP